MRDKHPVGSQLRPASVGAGEARHANKPAKGLFVQSAMRERMPMFTAVDGLLWGKTVACLRPAGLSMLFFAFYASCFMVLVQKSFAGHSTVKLP